jgi:hypothetical protein
MKIKFLLDLIPVHRVFHYCLVIRSLCSRYGMLEDMRPVEASGMLAS